MAFDLLCLLCVFSIFYCDMETLNVIDLIEHCTALCDTKNK